MAVKKSERYSSLWVSCNSLRGGRGSFQYKDYIPMFFIKQDYVTRLPSIRYNPKVATNVTTDILAKICYALDCDFEEIMKLPYDDLLRMSRGGILNGLC